MATSVNNGYQTPPHQEPVNNPAMPPLQHPGLLAQQEANHQANIQAAIQLLAEQQMTNPNHIFKSPEKSEPNLNQHHIQNVTPKERPKPLFNQAAIPLNMN